MVGDGEVRAELPELIVIKWPGVVRDDNFGDSEPVDYIFPYEIFGISICDLGERFRLYSFGEVIDGDD